MFIKIGLTITLGLLLGSSLVGMSLTAQEPSEMRCGWFSNPTPANASLFDRDGEWLISVQGGHQADGDWPDFKPSEWVKTNVNYGYGCACLQVRADHQEKKVMAIESARALPLSKCRQDRSIRRWGFK